MEGLDSYSPSSENDENSGEFQFVKICFTLIGNFFQMIVLNFLR